MLHAKGPLVQRPFMPLVQSLSWRQGHCGQLQIPNPDVPGPRSWGQDVMVGRWLVGTPVALVLSGLGPLSAVVLPPLSPPVPPPEGIAPPLPVVPPPDKPPSKACVPRGLEEHAKIRGMRRAMRFISASFPRGGGTHGGYDKWNHAGTSNAGSLSKTVASRT
jgi:hypothetical protein